MSAEPGRCYMLSICILMVITGSLNTICAKWADEIKVDGISFNHPYLQAGCMFIGEFLCMFAFIIVFCYRKYSWSKEKYSGKPENKPRLPRFNMLVFITPTICDIISTSVNYVGLTMTTASSYQMLRGALIVGTGILSIIFLRARIKGFQWLGMILVVLGLAEVGITDIMFSGKKTGDNVLLGDILCVASQLVAAVRVVLEQKYLRQYDVDPLFAVGLEGIYGIVIVAIMMIPMYYIHVPATFSSSPQGRLEDVLFAWSQICEKPLVAVALAGATISIAFFNFASTVVTKVLSGTTRTVLDSVRVVVIWVVSIPLFGQKFIALQLLGFALLLSGMFIYNDILCGPWYRRRVLSEMDRSQCLGKCCYSFCGVDSDEEAEKL